MASTAVDGLLGAPDLIRFDGPAEVRLYRHAETACTFHVFLYASNSTAPSRAVEHYEARNPAGRLQGADLTDCYRALVGTAEIS